MLDGMELGRGAWDIEFVTAGADIDMTGAVVLDVFHRLHRNIFGI